jgi:hypothetical protein
MDYHRGFGKNLCVLGVLRGFIYHQEHREHRGLRKNLCVLCGAFLFTTESTESTEV